MESKPYTVRWFFRNQDHDTIKKMKKWVNYTSYENMTQDEQSVFFIIFMESNSLLRKDTRNFCWDEDWLIDYYSCFTTFICMNNSEDSDDFEYVRESAMYLLWDKWYK